MHDETKHEGPHGPHHDHHKPGMWKSWSSWESPVGLGIFFLTTALAAAIMLYALLNLAGALLSVMHPAPSYAYPADGGSMMLPSESGPGATTVGPQ